MVKIINQKITNEYSLYHGDCVEVIKGLPDNSVGFSIFSPPFISLFTYSNSERDMGNSGSDGVFAEHFKFLIKELYRVIKPGRSVSIHCMNIPAMKERDGYIGLKDFRGDIIRVFQACGFIFHSEHVIWKDPLIEAVRTKALGLMHKQIVKDSSRCRAGLPDYLVTMRKAGENTDLISNPNGFFDFVGDSDSISKTGNMSHNIWRAYASPVWMDIRQTHTLNKDAAREKEDERHICPLQLDVIERALILWSKEGDIVASPFTGIGSEGYVSVKMNRKFIGIELKQSYYRQAVRNLRKAKHQNTKTKQGFLP